MDKDQFFAAAAGLQRLLREVAAHLQTDPDRAERDHAEYKKAYFAASKEARAKAEQEAYEKWKEWRDDPSREDTSAIDPPRFEFSKMYIPKVGRLPDDVPRLFLADIDDSRRRLEIAAALFGLDIGDVGAEIYRATCAKRAVDIAQHLHQAIRALDDAGSGARQAMKASPEHDNGNQVDTDSALAARVRVVARELQDGLESQSKVILARLSATGGRRNPRPLLELLERAIESSGNRLIDAQVRHGIVDAQRINNTLKDTIQPPVDAFVEKFFRRRSMQERALEEIEKRIEHWFDVFPDRITVALADGAQMADDNQAAVPQEQPYSRRVFLVHGHDDGAKETAARLLEKLGLDVIILHEKPNQGRTIIEKFEAFSDVGFAVVILTGDDLGRAQSATDDDMAPRARQNVILELGFFLGKLGRSKVCALYRDEVEIPSDYRGVLFVRMDNEGAWRMSIAREIDAAGIDVDLTGLV